MFHQFTSSGDGQLYRFQNKQPASFHPNTLACHGRHKGLRICISTLPPDRPLLRRCRLQPDSDSAGLFVQSTAQTAAELFEASS
ncbi:unnamed protein product [Protopolystoma xenopodis]|uniref:Uncharacterized protein n=1 Tax=Protopolystoma xenopodis TaxID=117903 RepID=A0A448WYU1_9PLAT|nr:unnamed protein product [Protopolystoma xenopodis]